MKIVNDFEPLTIFAKKLIIDVQVGSKQTLGNNVGGISRAQSKVYGAEFL